MNTREVLIKNLEQAQLALRDFHAETSLETYVSILEADTVGGLTAQMKHAELIRNIFEAEEALKKV